MDEKSGFTQQPYNPEYNNQSAPPPYPGPQYPPQQQPYGKSANPYPQGGGGSRPVVVYVPPLSKPPNDYLLFNIAVTICCCWPIGIFAILKSVESRDAAHRGDAERAQQSSRTAKKLGLVTLFIGVTFTLLSLVLTGLYVHYIMSAEEGDGEGA